jgi:hypothetical protein
MYEKELLMKKLVIFFLCLVIFNACASKPKTVPRQRAPKFEREYLVNEPWRILPDRVIQGFEDEKVSIAMSGSSLESTYTTRKLSWELSEDIQALPQLQADEAPLLEALYNLALEEAIKDIRKDGAFMAGKKWTGVWTRDISYSIHLSLAYLFPENSKISLMTKVNEFGEIIQDTGTGGSWPVSTDRISWATAAWEIYRTTGDREWLETFYPIVKASLDRDRAIAFDTSTGLYFGETSFLDWREQSYAQWMEPKDIFESKAFSTNLLFFQGLTLLSQAAELLGKPDEAKAYSSQAEELQERILSAFKFEDRNLFSLYLHPPAMGNLRNEKTGTLGNSLSILFNLDEEENARLLSESMPVVPFGIPTIYPQQPKVPPYHNSGIWPFVASYYLWAAAETGNEQAVDFSLKSLTRSAALFLSHKENMVFDTGHDVGTEINSDRQLWSVAGYLSSVYRGIFGFRINDEGIGFKPQKPDFAPGTLKLSNFTLQNTNFTIELQGSGTEVQGFIVNGEERDPEILLPYDGSDYVIQILLSDAPLKGAYSLIPVDDIAAKEVQIRDIEISQALDSPLNWRSLEASGEYFIWDGIRYSPAENPADFTNGPILSIVPAGGNPSAWYPRAEGLLSFRADPEIYEYETDSKGREFTRLEKANLSFEIDIETAGTYLIRFVYANGNGPINTNNKCAIRLLDLNDQTQAAVIFPQRGEGQWSNWGYSSSLILELPPGPSTITLRFDEVLTRNMNVQVNNAAVEKIELIPWN